MLIIGRLHPGREIPSHKYVWKVTSTQGISMVYLVIDTYISSCIPECSRWEVQQQPGWWPGLQQWHQTFLQHPISFPCLAGSLLHLTHRLQMRKQIYIILAHCLSLSQYILCETRLQLFLISTPLSPKDELICGWLCGFLADCVVFSSNTYILEFYRKSTSNTNIVDSN